jgi:hypothetical protein
VSKCCRNRQGSKKTPSWPYIAKYKASIQRCWNIYYLMTKVSNINGSVQWIILWGVFICFLFPIFWTRKIRPLKDSLRYIITMHKYTWQVASQIRYAFGIQSLPVFTTGGTFRCPIAANLPGSKPSTYKSSFYIFVITSFPSTHFLKQLKLWSEIK